MGSKQVDGFRKLQIVDLSFNHFNHQIGDKPRSMYMDEDDRSYYQESLTVTNKGFEREMKGALHRNDIIKNLNIFQTKGVDDGQIFHHQDFS
ncbi:hypothetical protein F8388_009185 [Cannabis sativa]|uniref:Uncharacterized protein n=1 Tax=Cannabis sativa TaxID=3483 RepID=A0A7J6GJP8_CANSA|nr:hypothetical protein F8388_009185 [Cannabis sativa]